MNKTILLTVIVGGIVYAGINLFTYPYKFYMQALSSGVSNERLTLPRLPDTFYQHQDYLLPELTDQKTGDENLWKSLHFQNFVVPMPFLQPLYMVVPLIKKLGSKSRLGYHVTDRSYEKMISLEIKTVRDFKFDMNEQWLFNLPIYRNYIYSKSLETVWSDLFRRDIATYDQVGSLPFSQSLQLNKRPHKELVYDLFILHLRKLYFPADITGFKFAARKKMGIFTFPEQSQQKEILMVMIKGKIHTLELTYRRHLLEAKFMHQLVHKVVQFQESSEDAQIALYAEHRNMNFHDRFTQKGMVLLFAALSHNIMKEEMLKELIRYMERGKAEDQQIRPFYDYAYSQFDTNFSEIDFYRKESTEQFLQRKAEEQIREEKKQDQVIKRDRYESEEDKVRDYLKKAKEGKSRDSELDSIQGL